MNNLEWIHLWELPFIKYVQTALNHPYLDVYLKFITLFDNKYVLAALVLLIALKAGWRWGSVTAILLLISRFVNSELKSLFEQPRPFVMDPSILHPLMDGSFGLPSGAAQTSVILAGLLIYAQKKPWAWALGIFFGISLSFSRVYIGVHFFTDLIAGWLIGAAIFSIFFALIKVPCFKSLENKCIKR